MSLYAALIDKSEITKKMLSHCLYYFAAEIQRFNSFEEGKTHFANKQPDIIFVDWDVKNGDKAVVYSVMEEIKQIPVVLLYRAVDSAQISSDISHKIQKPMDPKRVRDTTTELVSKVKESKVHPFLKFPKVKETTIKETSQTLKKELSSQEEAIKAKAHDNQTTLQEENKQTKALQDKVIQKLSLDETLKTSLSLKERKQEKIDLPLFKDKGTSTRKIEKENINIDENTQNDLAPMAIKSSDISQTHHFKDQNFKLSEKDILRILNKYKDTLEFQELMEKTLSDYAKKAMTNILQGNKITDLLQQPLNDFKESQTFKELVEKQIIQYVKKQLPLLIKEIVEQKIQQIIGD